VVFAWELFPHLTSEAEEVIEFRIKTRKKDGLILWQGQSPDDDLSGEDCMFVYLLVNL
jgi:hypothetical protein